MYRYRYRSAASLPYLLIALVVLSIWTGRGVIASPDVAIRTLAAQGFSNVQIVDHTWFAVGFRGCDEKDAARFTARATNAAGRPAEVYVCTGVFFKGGTVRVQ